MSEKERRPISLMEVMKHSKQVQYIDILGMKLSIYPWTIAQLEVIKPLVQRIFEEVKKRKKDEDLTTALLSILSNDGFYQDALEMVYTTLERGNQEIQYNGEVYDFFSKEEFKQHMELNYIVDIVKIVYKQNFEKNLLTESEPKKEMTQKKEEPQQEAQ